MLWKNVDVSVFEKIRQEENVVLLDVRTAGEYLIDHLEEAINIDVKLADFVEEIEELDPNKTYLVYCRIGVRSANACQFMALQGFSKLYNLKGGIVAWRHANKDL